MNLLRTLHMIRSMLAMFLCEVELYPLLAVSREMHAIVRSNIATLQAREKLHHQKLRADIERDLALIAEARASLSSDAAAALDHEVVRLFDSPSFRGACVILPTDEPRLSFGQLSQFRSLVFAGARFTGMDIERFPIMAKIVRLLLIHPAHAGWAGSEWEHRPNGADPQESEWAREFIQLCFLSNPSLCHQLRERRSNTDRVEELDLMFVCVLYLSRDGVKPGRVHLPSMLALADLCLWFVQLYHLTPLLDDLGQRRTSEEVIFDECTAMIGQPPLPWPFRLGECAAQDNPPRLRQMRWSILRACTGGGEAYGRGIFCHAPLIDSKLHSHPLLLCANRWADDAVCAVCHLGELHGAYSCSSCQFQVHAACAPPIQSHASSSSSSSSSSQSSSASSAAPALTPPSEWFHEQLASSSTEFLQAMWTARPDLLGVLIQGSNPAFWLRLRWSLILHRTAPHPPCPNAYLWKSRPTAVRSLLSEWVDGAMRDSHTRHRFTTILTHPMFSAVVMQMHRGVEAEAAPSYLLQVLFFDLLRRKERTVLQRWLSAERRYFLSVWPRLLDFASGLSPLHFLCARVRGCRHRLFQLLLQFTCDSLSTNERVVAPSEILLMRSASGATVRDLLALPRNRDLLDSVAGL